MSTTKQKCVLGFIDAHIVWLKDAGKFSTARNYEKTRRSFSSFLGGNDVPFSAVTGHLVGSYEAFLHAHGVVRNSASFYMRILRSTYNRAVKQNLVKQTFPFNDVYTGIDRTRKRAVDEDVIFRLHSLELGDNKSLSLARDLFVFSFCTRGMAFVDMAYLRKTDIRGGNICYSRHKTGQRLTVRIEPSIGRIIEKYSNVPGVYVFPILKSDDSSKAFSQYQIALNYYNRRLKRLSEMLQLDHGLSSYTARHTWATAARNHNVPLSVISAGMGHTSERTTIIYLSTMENSTIDAANQKIIGNL